MGRLSPARSTQEARAELSTLVHQLPSAPNRSQQRFALFVTPAAGVSEGQRQYFLLLTRLLSTIAGILLLVVCANVGGILVARGTARNAKIAMRRSLGASASRISSLLLLENLLVAAGGGSLAVLFSLWTSKWLAGFYSIDSKGYRILFDVRLDARLPSMRLSSRSSAACCSLCCPSGTRIEGPSLSALPALRQAISAIDSRAPIAKTMPLLEQVRGAYTDARLAGAVLVCAALLSVLLSAIGLFGVMAYEVGQRKPEIGIRLALGATPRQVVVLFLKRGLGVILSGCVAGIFLSLATSRLLSAWLFNVRPSDLLTLGFAALLLSVVALLAGYVPSRRAMQVDPVQALRYE